MLINGGRIMKIAYAKSAVKYIEALDRPTKHRRRKAIEGLTDSPPKGDIKMLQGYSDGRKRLRVGKFEILYIMSVDTRGDIYK